MKEDPKETGFYLGLQDEAKSLDKAILSMQEQLKQFYGEPNQWYRQCAYSLELAKRHRKTVRQSLKSIFKLSAAIVSGRNLSADLQRQKIAAEERARMKLENIERVRSNMEFAHAAKMARIEASNRANERFLRVLREVLREELGEPERLRIYEKARRIAEEKKESSKA